MATLLQRRLADRRRQMRFRERQKAEGKSPITVYISSNAKKILKQQKEKTGESNSEIIERALLNLKHKKLVKRTR
jgi:hypothetical protein